MIVEYAHIDTNERTSIYAWFIGLLPGLKWLRCEVDYLSPSNAELKNEWSHTSTPPICLDGVYSDKFTFFTAS